MINILNGGMFTTVQDLGRSGYQSKGIPVSGAMDKMALLIGNILNGNEKNAAGLEITYSGFKCEFLSDMTIALTGADLDYRINDKKIPMNQTLYINRGDVLSVLSVLKGIRGYLTVLGGIDVDDVLGSKSTYLKGEFGGYKARKLKKDDKLKSNVHKIEILKNKRIVADDFIKKLYDNRRIKVVLGPEEDRFTAEGIDTFLSSNYKLCLDSDRMGYRLAGNKIEHTNGADILSSPLTYGSIQVAGNGQAIIMMADRQTTGGYTKIAHVISADHSYLSQLKADEVLKFEEVSIEVSQDILRSVNEDMISLESKFSKERICDEKTRRFSIVINNNEYNVKVSNSELLE